MMDKKTLPKSFNDLVNSADVPVLVDFWAEWCGPCRMISPSIQKIAAEFKGKLIAVKVNVDDKPHIAAQYQIQSIPTVMMFHKGKIIMRLTGAYPYDSLRAEITSRLGV